MGTQKHSTFVPTEQAGSTGTGIVWRPRPEDEALVTVWSGDSWRQDPPPREPDARDQYLAKIHGALGKPKHKRSHADKLAQLTLTQRKTLKLLTGHWRSVRELALRLNIERSTVQKPLTALMDLELIERKPLPATGQYRGRAAFEYRALAVPAEATDHDDQDGDDDVE